jgi:hypothetical protein
MVNTRSLHPLTLLAGARAASINQEIMDFMKSIAKSLEVLKKQNEDLNTWLTVAEARSSQKEREHEERHEKERQDKVCRGKRPVNPEQLDNESTVQGENEENRDKSRRVESPNGGSRRERSRHERFVHEGSRRERHDKEKSHHERQGREKSQHDESHHSHRDEEVEDLKRKYAHILC